ncbi:MAG TPA: hypothetical protein VMS17_05565 [Gemmataceae bacterium]|nr:hypothetical protein [Gemmataceae bacterium]
MTKRTIAIGLAAVAVAAVAGTAAYFLFRDRFAPAHGPAEVKKDDNDKAGGGDDPDDPSLFKAAPVSLSGGLPARSDIQRRRAAVLRGKVLTPDGKPLEKAKISIAGSSSGLTLSNADGGFDFPVNGGGPTVIVYEKQGFLTARRPAAVPWQDYVVMPDVVLAPAPAPVGVLKLPWHATDDGAAPSLRGESVPGDLARQPTLIAPPGLTAAVQFSGGAPALKEKLSFSLREYAAAAQQAETALPAAAPPASTCAYAFELAVEQASPQMGARWGVFRPSVNYYVENFLHLPVGTELPIYHYEADPGRWVRSETSGAVIRVDDFPKGLNDSGDAHPGEPKHDGTPGDADAKLAEAMTVHKLYGKEQTLWRLPLTKTGTWAIFFPIRPPDGAVPPPWAIVSAAEATAPVSETTAVAGTPFQLCYSSDRAAPRMLAPCTLNLALTGAEVPKGLKRIELDVQIAGTRRKESFDKPGPNLKTAFHWDGLDAYGRPAPGRRPATVRIGYVYDGLCPIPQEAVLWREQRVMLGGWDARTAALGGWTLNVHHAYDPIGRVLYLGGGGRREAAQLPAVATTVAGGTGVPDYNDDDQLATLANLNLPRGLVAGPDGSVYVADARQGRVRRIKPDGLIATAAGNVQTPLSRPIGLALGSDGYLTIADDGEAAVLRLHGRELQTAAGGQGARADIDSANGTRATSARISHLRGLALGPYGDLFVTQHYNNNSVCRVDSDGNISFFLGGPTDPVQLHTATAVVAAPDGTVYVADADGCRVWRVGPDRKPSVAAGTGTPGFSGDGGPADKAQMNEPSGLALGPDGSLYVADARNGRIRRVAPDGVITTVAGGGQSTWQQTGERTPALEAQLALYLPHNQGDVSGLVGVAVGPDGDLYISDVGHGSVRRISPAFDGISDSEILIQSENHKELYVFDGLGRHLKTLDAETGALIYRFVYDAAWRLKEIHDRSGAVTKVERKAGRPIALVAPGGERTTLETGADSRLTRITPPGAGAFEIEYNPSGLLTSFKDAKGQAQHFQYAEDGRPNHE